MDDRQAARHGVFGRFARTCRSCTSSPNARECMTKGVNLQDFADTLQIYEGSLYVNDFNLFGRTWQVIVQADQQFPRPDRGSSRAQGPQLVTAQMVPLGSLCRRPRNQRAAGAEALQHVSGRLDQRRRASRASARARRSTCMAIWPASELPQIDGLRMDRMSYLELMAGQHGDDHFRVRGDDGVSGAGGAVRKLVAAAGHHSGRADVPVERDLSASTWPRWTSTSSRRSDSWCWWAWPARTRF